MGDAHLGNEKPHRRPHPPKSDRRLDQRATGEEGIKTEDARESDASVVTAGLWALYARTKYLTRRISGERHPNHDPAELQALAGELVDLLGRTWQAGFKSEDLTKAGFEVVRRRSQ